MQLNDILEENSLKQISKKTKISEENIEKLLEKRFDKFDRVKAMGFLSIIEREFGIKLDELREEAIRYYAEHSAQSEGITVGLPISSSSKKGKSKWFLVVVFALLAYASWYFVTQFDKTHLNTLLPSSEDVTQAFHSAISDENGSRQEPASAEEAATTVHEEVQAATPLDTGSEALVITEATTQTPTTVEASQHMQGSVALKDEEVAPELNITAATQAEENVTKELVTPSTALTSIAIVPVGKLWFGMTQKENKEKKQQIIGAKQAFDVDGKSYLVATSTAPFSVVYGEEKKEFRDAKIHYLLLDDKGVRDLSKEEYKQLGGWGW